MSGKENVGRRGSEVQGHESVGRDEHTAEGKKDGRSGRVRRATFDDLKAIIDINDNVYEGFDYMEALFYTFMHSKLHVIYVHEEDGKLVSLYNAGFHPDCDDLVSGLSGRVRPSYQGRGFGSSDSSPLRTHLLKEHPTLRRVVGDTMYTPSIAEKMKRCKLLYHWNVLSYKLDDRQWLSRFTNIREKSLGAVLPFSLSYTKGTEWLERSDQLIRFVSKYAVDLFPVGPIWLPTPTNKLGLRYALSVAKVYVSLDPASTIMNSNCPSDLACSREHIRDAGRGLQRTRDRGQDGDIIGLSFSTVVPCKYGVSIDIFFYGYCENSFLSHVYSQLHHYVSITSDDVRFGVQLHFPLTIDSKNVEERLMEEMGGRLYSGIYSAAQAVQFISEIAPAKL